MRYFGLILGMITVVAPCLGCDEDGRGAGDGGDDSGVGGTDGANGGNDDEGGAGVGGRRPTCEQLQCINGRIRLFSGCPGPFTRCDPALNDGLQCVAQGPCPNEVVVEEDRCEDVDTDSHPAHCGACDRVCSPTELYRGVNRVADTMVADATYVYWGNRFEGWIERAPLTGGSATTLYAGHADASIAAMVVDSTHVYWASSRSGTFTSSIQRVPIEGGAPETLVSEQLEVRDIVDIAVDAANVYWVTEDGAVARLPLSGGEPIALAESSGGVAIAVDGDNVYWTAHSDANDVVGSLMKVDLDGGSAVALAEFEDFGTELTVRGDTAYWIGGSPRAVLSVPIVGGDVRALTSGSSAPTALAVDATHVYWTSWGHELAPTGVSGTVNRVAIDGDSVSTLARRLGDPLDIVVTGDHLVWRDDYARKVVRLAKNPCQDGVCVE